MQTLVNALLLTSSFFFKEIESLLRQPRLILSFVVGPVVLLGLFGIGFRSQSENLTAVLVLANDAPATTDPATLTRLFTSSITISQVTRDRAAANAEVRAGRADVAIVMPEDIRATLKQGKHPQFQVLYSEVDPLQASWVPFFSSLAIQDLNRRITTKLVGDLEARIGEAAVSAEQLQRQSQELEAALQRRDVAGSREALDQTRVTLTATGPATALLIVALSDDGSQSWDGLVGDLALVEAEVAVGQVGTPRQLEIARQLSKVAAAAAADAHEIVGIPAEVITAPFTFTATNMAGGHITTIAYYAPAVVALLLQHIAISLISLSMVRERMFGAMEMYRVAPVRTGHLLLGKSASSGLVLGLLAAILLVVIVKGIGVPLLGAAGWVAVQVALLIFASLGIGFLISIVSGSEMQAVQAAMLVFLGSTIFGDFFLPIDHLWEPVRTISYLLPMTYANMALRDVMLRGEAPSALALVGPALLGIVAYGIAARSIRTEMSAV